MGQHCEAEHTDEESFSPWKMECFPLIPGFLKWRDRSRVHCDIARWGVRDKPVAQDVQNERDVT